METSPSNQNDTRTKARKTPFTLPVTENPVQLPVFRMASSFLDKQTNVTITSFLRCTHHLRLKPETRAVPDLVPMRRTLRRVSMQIRVNMDIEKPRSSLPHQRVATEWGDQQYSIKISLCDGYGCVVQDGIFLPDAIKKQSSNLPESVTILNYSLTNENAKKLINEERINASILSDHFGINRTSAEAYGTTRMTEFSKPPHGLLYLQILVFSKDTGSLIARHWTPPLWIFTRVDGENTPNHSYLSDIAKLAVDSSKMMWREEDIIPSQMLRYSGAPKRATLTFYEHVPEHQGESSIAIEPLPGKEVKVLVQKPIKSVKRKDFVDPKPPITVQPIHDDDASTLTKPLSVLEPHPLTPLAYSNHNQIQMIPPITVPVEPVSFNTIQCLMSFAPSYWAGGYNYQYYHQPPPCNYAPNIPHPKRRPGIRSVTSISAEVDSE